MSNIMMLSKRFFQDDEGATLLEYGMLTLLITVLSIVAVRSIGSKVQSGFNTVNTNLP
ncbi:MAG: Flp family type IVb pilin [Gemmatimonadota bacterium]|nr:Flp family type IVb pilin [Gemmatimonadota bacterium]